MSALLGVGLPLASHVSACTKEETNKVNFSGKVLIVGAGAGGLSSGYLLQQQGIDFEILEASDRFGGRMRINNEFADFPIPLGAEWLETGTDIFEEIINDSSVRVNIETIADAPDRKFVNYSWYNFFDDYIASTISHKINFNTVVDLVDYNGDQIIVHSQDKKFAADKVIICVPLKILQDGDLTFSPTLPADKIDVINNTPIWAGFKAFIEFSNRFYQDEFVFKINPESDGQKIYYDATLGQQTNANILGLFVVGKPAFEYISLTESELKNFILSELDDIYNNQATPNYIKHISQNWNKEPYIKSGYMTDYADWKKVKKLGETVADKVYFAGGEYTDGEDWVSVHTAAQAAKKAVEKILG